MEGEVHVDPKHHRNFVARRGEVLRQIAEDYGGVIVSFPRSGVNSDRVVIKGAKECVEAAKKKILEIVEDLVCYIKMYKRKDVFVALLLHINISYAQGHGG